MSRRDMIIVAVLINAGLLVMLFISSLKHDDPSLLSMKEGGSQQIETAVQKREIQLTKTPVDQVDKILSDFGNVKSNEKIVSSPNQIAVVHTMGQSSLLKPYMKEEKKEGDDDSRKVSLASSEETSDLLKVVVKKGDVLEKIAKQHGTTTEAIMQMNDLKGTHLKIGQILHLPKESVKREIQKLTASLKTQANQEAEAFYVVKNGDNLWKIAIENHVKIDDLLKLNQLNEKKAKALKPGDKLRIR